MVVSLSVLQAEPMDDDSSASLFIELLLNAFPGADLYYPPRNLSDFLKGLFTASTHPEPLKHAIVLFPILLSWKILTLLFSAGLLLSSRPRWLGRYQEHTA